MSEFISTMDWRINEKTMNRWTALYGDAGEYRYGRDHAAEERGGKVDYNSKTQGISDLPTAEVLPWTPQLLDLKRKAEEWYLEHSGEKVDFNGDLLANKAALLYYTCSIKCKTYLLTFRFFSL